MIERKAIFLNYNAINGKRIGLKNGLVTGVIGVLLLFILPTSFLLGVKAESPPLFLFFPAYLLVALLIPLSVFATQCFLKWQPQKYWSAVLIGGGWSLGNTLLILGTIIAFLEFVLKGQGLVSYHSDWEIFIEAVYFVSLIASAVISLIIGGLSGVLIFKFVKAKNAVLSL